MTIIKKEQLQDLITRDYTVNNRTKILFNKNKIIFKNTKLKEAITIETKEQYKTKTIEVFTEHLIKELQTLNKLKIEVEDKIFINGIIY